MPLPVEQMPADLLSLVTSVESRVTMPRVLPTPRPDEGQSEAHWRAEVAHARAQHDATALEGTRLRERLPAPGGEPASVEFVTISGGDVPFAGKLYRPQGSARGAVLLFHGGAYWMGGGAAGFEMNDEMCRMMCVTGEMVVLNADYRLAPEDPYPAAVNDAEAAFRWLRSQADEFGFDEDRIAVFGISSGGNLAACTALRVVEGGRCLVRGVLLQAPSLDLAKRLEMAAGDDELAQAIGWIVPLYSGGHDPANPGLSPGRHPDLSTFPPTVIVTGSFDPLAEGAVAFAERLRAAGRSVVVNEYPMTHTVAVPEVFARNINENIAALRTMLDD